MARIDSAILHEIARVVQTRSKVPDRVQILKRQYQITYLEDHRQRMEDALRRHDSQVLNMLFGQLASKVKYQALRESKAKRAAAAAAPAARKSAAAPKRAAPPKRSATPTSKRVTGKASAKKAAVKPKKRAGRR